MTREDGGVDQRGGGVPGTPQTYSDITIQKFGGMNTVSPRGVFGQPNLLQNVVMDSVGGYESAPSLRELASFGSEIVSGTAIGGADDAAIMTENGVRIVNLTTETAATFIGIPTDQAAVYPRDTVIGWNTANANGGIVAYTLGQDPVELNLKLTPSGLGVAEYDAFVAGGGGVTVGGGNAAPASLHFEDYFDRADGAIGSSWATGEIKITNNQAALDPVHSEGKAYYTGGSPGENYQQVSVTVDESAGLIFWSVMGGTEYTLFLTPGRSLQVWENGTVIQSLGVVPGEGPVRLTATFTQLTTVDPLGGAPNTAYRVRLTYNGENGGAQLALGNPPRVGIILRDTAKADLFRWTKQNVAPGTLTTGMQDAYQYPEGTRHGFDPRTSHWVFMYRLAEQYVNKPKLGTTLNPRPSKASRMRPIILHIPPYPGGITKEYKLVFNNPDNVDFHFYGAAKPEKRSFKEYSGVPVDKKTLRAGGGATVAEGTLVSAAPINPDSSISEDTTYSDLQYVYQALEGGKVSEKEPDWPASVGATLRDGEVTWVNRGINFNRATILTFAEYISHVSNPPVDYLRPEIEWVPKTNALGPWEQLYAQGTPGGVVEVFRSKDPTPDPYYPHSFFPAGKITELHLARTWVMADAVWRSYVKRTALTNVVTDMEEGEWETTTQRRTVYYSEPETPWLFIERFINLPMDKSRQVVAMRSLGEYLVFLGDADAVVLSGDSEANFNVSNLDIPGAFSQNTTATHQGVLYYRGVGGIYRMSGGRAEEISKPIANLIPRKPTIPDEGLAVDGEFGRLLVRVATNQLLVFDIATEAWSVLAENVQPLQVGKSGYGGMAGKLYALDGKPNKPMLISYRDLDGGSAVVRKSVKSVSMVVESDSPTGTATARIRAHRPNAASSTFTEPAPVLVNQTINFTQFRVRDRVGYAFDLEIILNPGGERMVLKPSISLELYPDAVTRKGY